MRGETTTDDPDRGCASGVQPTKVVITPLLIELHWPPVAARIKFKSLMLLAYRVIADSAPTYLNALVRANVTPRMLRSSSWHCRLCKYSNPDYSHL